MKKHHILCIHGLGKHDNDWVRTENDEGVSFETNLKRLWDGYMPKSKSFENKVKLHSIHYDDKINKIFDSWEEQVQALKDGLVTSPLQNEVPSFIDIIDKASEAKDSGDLLYTHLFDLLLFIGSPSLQYALVNYVGQQILSIIDKYMSNNDYFTIVAHSMGTAMAHKVIQALFNEQVEMENGIKRGLPGNLKFQNVTMVSNTSYLLSRDRERHYTDTWVRPFATVGKGCCRTWINVNHKYDPISQFARFDYKYNPAWLDQAVETHGFHKDILLEEIITPNIHSLNNHFNSPYFYVPFFKLLFGYVEKEKKLQKKTR